MAPIEELEFENIDCRNQSAAFDAIIEFVNRPPRRPQAVTDPDIQLLPLNQNHAPEIPPLPNLGELLRTATGSNNLESVVEVKLKVIAQDVGLQHLSIFTPVLRELTLDGSVVSSLRDLGCGLKSLKILKVNRCRLTSLDGVRGVKNLEQLYAASNSITDLTPCTYLERIQNIDVRRNKIADINSLSFLNLCTNLKHLVLDGNPKITNLPNYRAKLKTLLPNLITLDEVQCIEDELPEILDTIKSDTNKEPATLPSINQGSSTSRMQQPSTSNCSYSVQFSPRVLSPRVESETKKKCDIKVTKNCLPKINKDK